ncbi:MAG: hypothetical protein QM784_32255 [Polyangiaceae bacterium]
MAFALRWHIPLLLLSSTAFGQTAEKAAAVVLFDEAEALAARGELQAACPKYAESHRLDPQLGALLHVADCYERVSQFARAWSGFREAAELAEKRGDSRVSVARARAIALEARVSRLSVIVPETSRVSGLAIFVDGVELGRASWAFSPGGWRCPSDSGDCQRTRGVRNRASRGGRRGLQRGHDPNAVGNDHALGQRPLRNRRREKNRMTDVLVGTFRRLRVPTRSVPPRSSSEPYFKANGCKAWMTATQSARAATTAPFRS